MVFRLLATTELGAKYPDAHRLGNGSHPDHICMIFSNFAFIQIVIIVNIDLKSKSLKLDHFAKVMQIMTPPRCKTMPTPPRNGMVVVPQVKYKNIDIDENIKN